MDQEMETKSNLEIVAEFLADNPEVAAFMNPEQFGVFYQYPQECIDQYNASLKFLRESFRIPEDIIKSECKVYITEACDAVNLNHKDA